MIRKVLVPREGGWSLGGFEAGRRLAFRLRTGEWCPHAGWSTGQHVEWARKVYHCLACGHVEIR